MKTCERKPQKAETGEKLDLAGLHVILDKHVDHTGALIPVLQEAQKEYGYLAQDIMETIANGLGLPLSQVYGVATFYSQFRLRPHGEHTIKVCQGTACHVGGAKEIIEAIGSKLDVVTGGTTADRKFTLESVACLGCCSLAPLIMIDDEAHGQLTPQKATKIVRNFKKKMQG